ncbi:MAG: hypothetical protein WD200_03055 [Candidatus Andersenbacteria bacterium]
MSANPPVESKSAPRRKKRRVVLVVLILLILSGVLGVRFFLRASQSDMKTLSIEDIKERLKELAPDSEQAVQLRALLEQQEGAVKVEAASAQTMFEGLGVRFSHPQAYTVREDKVEGEYGSKVLIAGIGGTRRLVVSRQELPGAFDEHSAVRLRRSKPQAYSERSLTLSGRQAVEFTGTDAAFEKVIFIPQGGQVTTIALSSLDPFGIEAAQKDYENIVSTIVVD